MAKTKKLINRTVLSALKAYVTRYPAWGTLSLILFDRPFTKENIDATLNHCIKTGDELGFRLAQELFLFSDEQWDEFLDIFGPLIASPLS